jgi:hypothetical protein
MRHVSRVAVLVACGVAGAALLAGCGSTRTVVRTTTVTVAAPAPGGAAAPRQWLEYGHIAGLKRAGSRYRLRFDPAWFLSGTTANVAAAEDGVIPKGAPMPNDNYGVDESHRLYTYLVPANARVTVLKDGSAGIASVRISAAELARIVNGTSRLKLFEPLASGVWITVRGDSVVALDQQYKP